MIQGPYLLFIGDAIDQIAVKVANGVAQWRPELCMGQFRLPSCQADLGLADMTMEQAANHGVKTVVVGVANRGGVIQESWLDSLGQALDLDMNIAAGLHQKLSDIKILREKAKAKGKHLYDVRHPTQDFSVAKGSRRVGKRVLTVGSDCAVGKMYTSLAIHQALKQRGISATFRATGQTGIFIEGAGVSVDAVVSDFISGAVEWLTPENKPDHWDVVEGQGALFHPSFAGVSLGLLHGAQPDALVVCHAPGRPHMRGVPDFALPNLADVIAQNEHHGRLVNPNCKVIALSCNTKAMADKEAEQYLTNLAQQFAMPAIDPLRHGATVIADILARL